MWSLIFFTNYSGVKQGGVISLVLFCIYIDDLVHLSLSGVGCYIGLNFCWALAYTDDIVLIAATASSIFNMLSVCETFAARFDIQFNVQKSECLMVSVRKWGSLCSIKVFDVCHFYLDSKPLEFVESYSNLGHIITNTLKDSSDIVFRRGRLIGQINSVGLLCYFGKLDSFVAVRLLKCFCYSLYGCELWGLDSRIALMDSVLLGGRA